MKKLFYFLLNAYSKTEAQRMKIFSILHEQVCEEYNEQTVFGNIYNANIEFLMSNEFLIKKVKADDREALEMIANGLNNSYKQSLDFIKNEL